jgi:hypothetical protein
MGFNRQNALKCVDAVMILDDFLAMSDPAARA